MNTTETTATKEYSLTGNSQEWDKLLKSLNSEFMQYLDNIERTRMYAQVIGSGEIIGVQDHISMLSLESKHEAYIEIICAIKHELNVFNCTQGSLPAKLTGLPSDISIDTALVMLPALARELSILQEMGQQAASALSRSGTSINILNYVPFDAQDSASRIKTRILNIQSALNQVNASARITVKLTKDQAQMIPKGLLTGCINPEC